MVFMDPDTQFMPIIYSSGACNIVIIMTIQLRSPTLQLLRSNLRTPSNQLPLHVFLQASTIRQRHKNTMTSHRDAITYF
jgi:hypothetical protein